MNERTQDVAVIGSPSTTTELTLDLLQEATEEKLVGALTFFQATQDGNPIMSVGQIVAIQLKNRWHEDSVFRNLIKRTGEIPPITNRQDTRTAELIVGATFRKSQQGYEPDLLGMVPPTGTVVSRVEQQLLNEMLKVYEDDIFYLGKAYANDLLYPMWFKHFDSGPGGLGEAHHLGVFGKTGSGKSGLAKMLLCAYARHAAMGILVIDPQGEFSLELSGTRVGQQGLAVDRIVRGQGRDIRVYRIEDLQLDDWATFESLQVSRHSFLDHLEIPRGSINNARKAAEVIRIALQRTDGIRLDNLANRTALNCALDAVTQRATFIYARDRAAQLQDTVRELREDPQRYAQALTAWNGIGRLFEAGDDRVRLFTRSDRNPGIIDMLIRPGAENTPRPVVAIDVSEQGNREQGIWSEELQRLILNKLFSALMAQATTRLGTEENCNVLVVLDEAGRHAPSGSLKPDSEAYRLRSLLSRAVRETRKYGIGWFFISQTLGGFYSQILQQLRIVAFGFGLSMGTEFDRLKTFVADKRSLELYRSFQDPHSFPRRDLREFPFMAVGPVSPLAFSGKPLFFSAFTNPDRFVAANKSLRDTTNNQTE